MWVELCVGLVWGGWIEWYVGDCEVDVVEIMVEMLVYEVCCVCEIGFGLGVVEVVVCECEIVLVYCWIFVWRGYGCMVGDFVFDFVVVVCNEKYELI